MTQAARKIQMLSAKEIVTIVKSAIDAELTAKQKENAQKKPSELWHPENVWASGIKDCAREMALDMTHPEDRGELPVQAFHRMKMGVEYEENLISRLRAAGRRANPTFEVIEQQVRFSVNDRDGLLLLTGKIDGRIKFSTGQSFIFEAKSGDTYMDIENLYEFGESPWSRNAPKQLGAYLLKSGDDLGFFIVPSRKNVINMIPVHLDDAMLAEMERVLVDVRGAVLHRLGKGPIPEFTKDPTNCRRCSHFSKSCIPPLQSEAVEIVHDDFAERACGTILEDREAAKRYEKAREYLSARMRGKERTVVGDYLVIGKSSALTKYEIPDEIKAQYKTSDPAGKFQIVEVQKVSS